MKRFTSVILIFAFTVPSFAPVVNAAGECKYSGKLTECVDANKNGSARSIEDFICKETSDQEQMLLQIILDDKFKEIDEEAEAYLEQLEQSKEEYFGDEPTKNFLSAIDDINKNFAQYEYYWQQYFDLCNGLIREEFLRCEDSITNINILNFLGKNDNLVCESLFETKLNTYKQVAYDILKLNRLQVRKDDRKAYVIEERNKYSGVMQLMLDILGYLERIASGWVTKTKHPHS